MLRILLLACFLFGSVPARAANAPLVLAAASLQESLTAAANAWTARGHPRPVLSFAGSSALARQIEAGGPADIFISADAPWMDHLETRGAIREDSRRVLLGNRLVLVAPLASKSKLRVGKGFPLARALGDRRLAMAEPETVPAGRYGRAALVALGVWRDVEPKVARAENVRAALALVERGEASFGIVYATDAKASAKVRVVGVFPEASHPPIRYPAALVKTSANPEAAAFLGFLASREARAIFARYGFSAP